MAKTATYVALLRGINVGGHQKVPMADLRTLLTGLGYTGVRTHLQSGNAVFTAARADPARLEDAISDRIAGELGLTVSVLVRTRDELATVVAANTLDPSQPSRFLVLFLSEVPGADRLAGIEPGSYAPEEFQVADREIYLNCATGILESALLKVFTDRRLGCAVTARNWNTVTKLLALADAP